MTSRHNRNRRRMAVAWDGFPALTLRLGRRPLRDERNWPARMGEGVCSLLWVAALAALLVGGVRTAVLWSGRQAPVATMRSVVVPHGGTLWGLAVRCAGPGQDPRGVASEIRGINHLRPGAVLHPGTRLVVPDYRAGAQRLAQNSQESG